MGAATLLAVGSARGALVLNPGFEALTGSDLTHFSASGQLLDGHAATKANPLGTPTFVVTPDPAPGWTVDNVPGGTMNPTSTYMPAGALGGQNVAYSTGAIIAQSFDLEPSTTYTLTVGVGRPNLAATPFAYHVWLSSGGLVRAEDFNSLIIAPGTWGTSTVTWTSPDTVAPGSKYTINLASTDGPVLFDNVQLAGSTSIPEPVTGLLAAAPFLLGLTRRRR
jgi:hypothetical protein